MLTLDFIKDCINCKELQDPKNYLMYTYINKKQYTNEEDMIIVQEARHGIELYWNETKVVYKLLEKVSIFITVNILELFFN